MLHRLVFSWRGALLGVLASVAAFAVFAAPVASANNGAIVLKGTAPSVVFDANGNLVSITSPAHELLNHSGAINVVVKGEVAPPASGTAVVWDSANTGGFAFNIDSCTPTTNWSESITPAGDLTLTAHFTGCA
jgi:hypothetical protein